MKKTTLLKFLFLWIGLLFFDPGSLMAQCATSRNFAWDDGLGSGYTWLESDLSRAYTNVDGSGINVTLNLTDPDNQNCDVGNPSGFGDYTETTGGFGNSVLTYQMTSTTSDQLVTFTFNFSEAIFLDDFTIFDIDYNGLVTTDDYDTFQDEVTFSASNGGANVALTLSQPPSATGSIVGVFGQTARSSYVPGVSGNVGHTDVNGAIVVSNSGAIDQLIVQYSNGPDDEGLSNDHAVSFPGFTFCEAPEDFDNDGISDLLDLDDDNDGIPDEIEACGSIGGGGNVDILIEVQLDGFPGETSWTLLDGGGGTVNSGSGYSTANQFISLTENVAPGNYSFNILDTYGDGLTSTGGYYQITVDGVLTVGPINTAFSNNTHPLSAGTAAFSCISGDPSADADGDGILNYQDADFCTLNANGVCTSLDADGDGIPNYLDLDADNDGIPDIVEAGGVDINGDGHIDYPSPGDPTSMVDADNDGLDDALDNLNSGNASEVTGGTPLANNDSDADGYVDAIDLDADNDGIPDLVEAGGLDTNGDGRVDTNTDSDQDGLADIYDENAADGPGPDGTNGTALVETDGAGNMLDGSGNSVDSDGDGLADHIDLDADNDGIPDVVEANGIDANGDGRVDAPTDVDQDGLADVYDENATDGPGPDGTNGTALIETDGAGNMLDGSGNSRDTDGDGLADHLDLDADNDGIPDLVETGGVDLTGIGMVDTGAAPWDSDGDGLADIYDENATDGPGPDGVNGTALVETTMDSNGDGIVNASETMVGGASNNVNADGDTVPNHLDLDSDNDGIVDLIEIGGTDSDNNGMVDALPISDSDGWLDAWSGVIITSADGADGNPYPDYSTGVGEPDFDGDGLPNYLDIDADNDGIVDNTEAQATTGYIAPTMDSDGDGLNDAYETVGTIGSFGGVGISPENTDSADSADYLDLDADNDAEPDIVEGHDSNNDGSADSGSAANTGEATGADIDFDGLDDGFDNNTASLDPTNTNTNPSSYPDTDAGLVDQDWRAMNQNIAGTVWEDINEDGTLDGGETLLSGVVVTLYDSGNSVVGTATTAADGSYLITDIPVATGYYLIFTKPAAYGNFSPQDQAGGDDTLDSDTDASGQTAAINISAGNAQIYFSAGVFGIPVPVNLAYFKGQSISCTTQLAWLTEAEDNFSHFEVERSLDGIHFETLVYLPSKQNQLGSNYGYQEAFFGDAYYRLKGVDLNGQNEYSKVLFIPVNCALAEQQLTLYPNPISIYQDQLYINLSDQSGMEKIVILDLLGKKVFEQMIDKEFARSDEQSLDISGLSIGTYTLYVEGRLAHQAARFIRVE